jgi:hypothetical protein
MASAFVSSNAVELNRQPAQSVFLARFQLLLRTWRRGLHHCCSTERKMRDNAKKGEERRALKKRERIAVFFPAAAPLVCGISRGRFFV